MPVTLTEKVHVEPAPGAAVKVPPLKLTVDGVPGGLLMVAVMVPLPHVPVTVVEVNFIPPGKVSVNPTPLSELAVLGLVTVKVKLVLPFNGMFAAPNALLIVGGATTVRVAVLLVAPFPDSVELIVLVVLGWAPALMPVTLTEKVHVEPAPGAAVKVPPLKLTVDGVPGGLLMVAVMVPLPHVPVTVV